MSGPEPPVNSNHDARQAHPELVSVGPYLLGALSRGERESFRNHLGSCPLCQAELVELSAVPAVLGAHRDYLVDARGASRDGDPEPSSETLERSLAQLRASSRRKKLLVRGLGAGLAACLVVIALLSVPGSGSRPAARARTIAFVDTPIAPFLSARMAITPTAWGVEVEVYAKDPTASGQVIEVMAVNPAGQTLQVATWRSTRYPVDCVGSAWWPASAVRAVELRDHNGRVMAKATL